jgi:iron-sulfur cluster assembly accessory protein
VIILTEKAVAKLKEMSEEMDIGHLSIRICVKGGGCSGFTRDMMFDDITNEMDEITEQDGVKIVIDSMSAQYLEGCCIDYTESLMSSGFIFNIPNTYTCGCGHSFSPE